MLIECKAPMLIKRGQPFLLHLLKSFSGPTQLRFDLIFHELLRFYGDGADV